jgi:carboxymethylenebutenolidase
VLLLALALVGCGGSDAPSASDTTAAEAAGEMAEAHEGDTPAATGAAREPAVPVQDTTVAYATMGEKQGATGYLAEPARPDSVLRARGRDPATGALPGLIVIHEWWGLNDNIRTATRRLAGEGYRALAVDLYDGESAETPGQARKLMQAAMENTDRLRANLKQAHDYLRDTGAPRVAVLGWCFGGGMALRAAAAEPARFDGAVVYYGSPEGIPEAQVRRISFPVIGFYGSEDQAISLDAVRAFEEQMSGAPGSFDLHVYDGAGHAFANPSGTNYDPEAAADAWAKTTRFLQAALAAPSGGTAGAR